MGSKLKHEPGTFCWVELSTTDSAEAKGFYFDLMGWQTHDAPIPGGGVYTMLRESEGDVGGMMQMTEEFGDMPSHWMVYFAVEDCDVSAGKVKSLGGEVRVPPTDIPEVGRFAVAQDPQGATFSFIKLNG